VEDESGPFFGAAATFISYFWQAAFVQLVRSHSPSGNPFYWVDILNCAQCHHDGQATEPWNDDMGKLAETIAQSQAHVCIVTPARVPVGPSCV
jgi:hypothetical protein